MALTLGSRTFAPRWLPTLATVIMVAVLLSLGRWQLHRADEKRALFQAFAAGSDSLVTLNVQSSLLPRYQHVRAHGHYDSGHQILLDNMVSADGRAGYFVITPFELDSGSWVLVNRGWVPLGASRAVKPPVDVPETARSLRGRVDRLPRPGITLGTPPPLSPPFPVVANYPPPDAVHTLLSRRWSGAAEAVLLEAGEPDGFMRDWHAPGFPPERHIGYAIQWFALAAALVVIYIVTNLRK